MKTYLATKFLIQRDPERCIQCQVCVNQCTFDTHYYDAEDDEVRSRGENCVGCHRWEPRDKGEELNMLKDGEQPLAPRIIEGPVYIPTRD